MIDPTQFSSLPAPQAPDGRGPVVRTKAEFERAVADWFDRVQRDYAPQQFRRLIGETFAAVVTGTPVGNKALWKRNRGLPASRQQPRNYVGGAARQAWRISVNGVAGLDPFASLAGVKLSDRVSITNARPYIDRLNQGWSTQAPAGYIDNAIRTVAAKYSVIR